MKKKLPNARRVRRLPTHFSWIDHRLVRDKHLSRCSSEALALYLFLVIVADAQGVSYYSGPKILEHLSMGSEGLRQARQELRQRDLIAWSEPFYQVLEVPYPEEKVADEAKRQAAQDLVGDILGTLNTGAKR